MSETETKPDWSCGGYVYDDAIGVKFSSYVRDGVCYPVLEDPGPLDLSDDAPIATLRWLRPEECPVHSEGTSDE